MLWGIYRLCSQNNRIPGISTLIIVTAASVSFFTTSGIAQELPEKYYKSQTGYLDRSSEQLFSPSAGQQFYKIAHQIAGQADTSELTDQQVRQAIILLNAAAALDNRADYILTDLVNIVSRYSQQDYSQMLLEAVNNYVDESTDIETARKAFQYLLGQLNSREDREKLLTEQLRNFTGKNHTLESELAAMLGLLAIEKTDVNTALTYFSQAYNSNRYNRLAFTKLVELTPETISAASYLEHLRLILSENPLDMQAALNFAQYAERLQLYDTAADAYRYCADLFNYLQPSEPMPSQIYMPWAINCYNSRLSNQKCMEIASQLRQAGQFDLLLEAIAGKAAEKTGDARRAAQILNTAERKTLELISSQKQQTVPSLSGQITNFQRLAWFHCFALPDAGKALDWANKAYSTDPNSPMTAAILAYALVMNGQDELAKSIVDSYEHNQINTLALAKIQLAQGQKDLAIESLKSAIAKDPASLEAEIARQILTEQGSVYIPPIDADIVLSSLESSLGRTLNLQFTQPEKTVSVQLNAKGTKFSYGSDFGGSITITNNSAEPLVISDDGLFTGRLRVDAAVTGDVNTIIPNLISLKICPPTPIGPGRSYLIPLSLDTGHLREILFYPQASLDMEFTAYLDPIDTDKGPVNRLAALPPAKITLKRPRIEVSTKYLQNRLNSLSKGQQGQKLKTAELFTGLLMEHYAIAQGKQTYKLAPASQIGGSADWMPDLFISALVHSLHDEDWVIRVHTMAGLLSVPMNYELTNAAAENLNDTHWPCRLIALYLLAKNQGSSFNKVLDWTAKYDPHNTVKDMAVALGGAKPPTETKQEQTQPPPQTSEPNSK